MKKQKLIILGLGIILLALIGSTSAYFVTSKITHNIITSGGVAIEFIENTNQTGVDGRPIPFTNIDNAQPGETYSKIPQVKNIDESEIWVRILVAKTAIKNRKTIALSNNEMQMNYDSSHWIDGQDGFFYYYRALPKNETTEPLFTKLTLADNLNETVGASTYQLSLQAQAVQAVNNGTNVTNAEGWPEE